MSERSYHGATSRSLYQKEFRGMLQWDAIRRSIGACCNGVLSEGVYGHVAMGCYQKEFRSMLQGDAIGRSLGECCMLQWDAIRRSLGTCCNGMLSEGV